MIEKYAQLADRIDAFLAKYGVKGADDEWNGPDSNQMACTAQLLRAGKVEVPWSEWSSGCYRPYMSDEGFKEHKSILESIIDLRAEHFKIKENDEK